MRDTYLVQRLSQPPKTEWQAKGSQVFGGGMLQLKPEAWKILQEVFDIEYMGSAEYEFGTLPASLNLFNQDGDKLEAFEITVPRKDIKMNWSREHRLQEARRAEIKKAKEAGVPVPRKKKPKKGELPGDATVYVLCRKEHREGATQALIALAGDKVRTKGSNNVARALDPVEEYDRKTCGWYELDNGFFFFTDRVMWERATALFMRGSSDS